MTGQLRIGPAGWSYRDWEGIVYPKGQGKDKLSSLASIFETIEINNTFYRIPGPRDAESWVCRTEGYKNFRFTVKLNRRFTHSREECDNSALAQFLEGIKPLMVADRLGAILIQFPWSVKYNERELKRIQGLIEACKEYPCVLEFRHESWGCEEVYTCLRNMGAGWCNIDQPGLRQCLGMTSIATSTCAYVRLHGRNSKDWFRDGAGRDARYNYLYNEDQLAEWCTVIRELTSKSADVFVICNNHFRGKAVCNALQLKGMLLGEKTRVPSALVEEYPEILKYTESGSRQLRLF
ncbi:DUF72 domain-containing protein [Acidobacteriota bacterium]